MRSEKARNRTVEGIAAATSAYNNATKMVDTLLNFEEELPVKKRNASLAKSFLGEINANMKDSKQIIKNLRENLNQVNSVRSLTRINLDYFNVTTRVICEKKLYILFESVIV
jgi:hypothetical protein